MSLWDPYSHDLYGNAITGRGPTVLRSPSGTQVTADQYLMAKRAYSIFCMRTRTSAVTNPVEIGALPDGSQYRIATVGNQTYVDVWPVQPAVDETRGGIGIVLTDLSGGVLAEHSFLEDSVPTAQPYILTPVERKGTRDSTGRWKVRKESYQGGKASFYHPRSKRYLTGMEGTPDGLLPPPPGNSDMAGVNVRANRIGFRIDGTPIYANRTPLPAGKFRGEFDTLPFFRRNAAGQLCWVQIVPEFSFGTRLLMYAGLYEPDETAYVGELVDTLEMPDGYSLRPETISPSPDGNTLRAVFIHAVDGSPRTAVDMAVGDASLSITSLVDYSTTVPGSASFVVEGTIPTGRTITETEIGGKSVDLEYGYDGKGQPVVVRPGTTFEDFVGTVFEMATESDAGDIRTRVRISNTDNFTRHATSGMLVNGVDVTFPRPSTTVRNHYTTTTVENTATSEIISVDITGSGSTDSKNYTALLTLISDPVTQFIVQVVNLRHFTQTSHQVAVNIDGVWTSETIIDSESETFTPTIQVMAKGTMIDEIAFGAFDAGKFAATIAADPVTGAICCNVLEFTDDTRDFVARSWIYVADDQGGKRLSQIMDVADSRDIRIRNDSTLLSV